MVVEEKNFEKMCSFYVSDFHLEMILLPYINKKIEEKQDIIIETEKDLNETVKTLISKMNLKEENKNAIINLGWGTEEKEIKENSNVIIIGTEKYIEQTNNKIKDASVKNVKTVDCYNFEEVKENINNIICKYDNSLNTLGYNKF